MSNVTDERIRWLVEQAHPRGDALKCYQELLEARAVLRWTQGTEFECWKIDEHLKKWDGGTGNAENCLQEEKA